MNHEGPPFPNCLGLMIAPTFWVGQSRPLPSATWQQESAISLPIANAARWALLGLPITAATPNPCLNTAVTLFQGTNIQFL
ncbi:unnamed protein product [Gadus morhua 'NCC']